MAVVSTQPGERQSWVIFHFKTKLELPKGLLLLKSKLEEKESIKIYRKEKGSNRVFLK